MDLFYLQVELVAGPAEHGPPDPVLGSPPQLMYPNGFGQQLPGAFAMMLLVYGAQSSRCTRARNVLIGME